MNNLQAKLLIEKVLSYKSVTEAAKELDLPRSTLVNRLARAQALVEAEIAPEVKGSSATIDFKGALARAKQAFAASEPPYQIALAFQSLLDAKPSGMSKNELAKQLGVHSSRFYEFSKIFELPKEIIEILKAAPELLTSSDTRRIRSFLAQSPANKQTEALGAVMAGLYQVALGLPKSQMFDQMNSALKLKNTNSLANVLEALKEEEFEQLPETTETDTSEGDGIAIEQAKQDLLEAESIFEKSQVIAKLYDSFEDSATRSRLGEELGIGRTQFTKHLLILELPKEILEVMGSCPSLLTLDNAYRLRALFTSFPKARTQQAKEKQVGVVLGRLLYLTQGGTKSRFAEAGAVQAAMRKGEVATVSEVIASYEQSLEELAQKELEKAMPKPSRSVQAHVELADSILEKDTTALDKVRLEEDLKKVTERLKELNKQVLTDQAVRKKILGIAHHKPVAPEWLDTGSTTSLSDPGVPILFASDWHWGEVVNPDEIGGVNVFDLAIARQRAKNMIERAINLLTNHMVNPNYPGIIFALGGDMVSGNIHDELCETNDLPIMPVVLDIIDHLAAGITRLKEVFGRVFIPCVAGNHGRLHRKVRMKQSNFNSYDWLIYQALDREFADDEDVVFYIPDGPDALVSVYNHRYLFTHGNQFRGGDGMIGAIGPIIRGDHKKRGRNAQVGQEYDTLVIGHFHQLIQMQRVIVNGSLKGYDEYAYASNFGYEPAQQALWITHPVHGITFSMPVQVETSLEEEASAAQETKTPWVSFHEAKQTAPGDWVTRTDVRSKAA